MSRAGRLREEMEKAKQASGMSGEAQPMRASKVFLRCGSKIFAGRRRGNGRLDVPGGVAEGEETPLECALRETLEEIIVNDANCKDWLECRLRESRTRRVCYVVEHKTYLITLFHIQCRYRDILGLTEDGMREMKEPGWLEIDAILREKRDRSQETESGSLYAAAIQELLADNGKREHEATPVASKAGYCDTMRQLKRKTDVQGEPRACGKASGYSPGETIPRKPTPGQSGMDNEPPERESADIGSRGWKGTPSYKDEETPRKAWPGRPRHSNLGGRPKMGVVAGETPQREKGRGVGTAMSSSASVARATQGEEDESGRSEEHQPMGSPNARAIDPLDSTPCAERRQRFAALGRDIQALAQELVKKDDKVSDEEDETEIRAWRGRHSFNFLT